MSDLFESREPRAHELWNVQNHVLMNSEMNSEKFVFSETQY